MSPHDPLKGLYDRETAARTLRDGAIAAAESDRNQAFAAAAAEHTRAIIVADDIYQAKVLSAYETYNRHSRSGPESVALGSGPGV
jgi:hypothetical protein